MSSTGRARSRFSSLRAFSAMDRQSAQRTPVVALGLFLMPLVVTALIGFAVGSYRDPPVRVGVLDHADTPESRSLLDALRARRDLSVRSYDDEEWLKAGVHRGRLAGGLVLPPGWDGSALVLLYAFDASPSAPLVRAHLDVALAEIARAKLAGSAPPPPVDGAVLGGGPEPRLLGFLFTAPANLVMFALIAGCTASARLVFLRRAGIGARLAATPAGPLELLAGLAIGPVQLVATQAVFLLATGWLVFGVSWGPPLAVALLTASLVGVAGALALFLGTVYRSVEQPIALGPFLGMALGMLGGCWWPLETAPASLRALARAFPSTWAMEGYLDLIARGGGLPEVLPAVAVLLGMAAVLSAGAAWRLRRMLAR